MSEVTRAMLSPEMQRQTEPVSRPPPAIPPRARGRPPPPPPPASVEPQGDSEKVESKDSARGLSPARAPSVTSQPTTTSEAIPLTSEPHQPTSENIAASPAVDPASAVHQGVAEKAESEDSARKLSPVRAPSVTPQPTTTSEPMPLTREPHQPTSEPHQATTENIAASQSVDPANVPLPSRTSSSESSHSASSAPQSLSHGGDTSCSTSTSGTAGIAVGTPESKSQSHASRLGVEENLETFGRKMSYALQVDAPLSQGLVSPGTVTSPSFSSPTLGADSRRGSRNDDLTHASESSSRWTPPGRISRPAGVSPSSARSPSLPSPDLTHSPRFSSTSSYLTKRQQQTQDLRSEVEEENRKRRERRTMVKDGYKIVDGVRAKASSSGVYTPPTFRTNSSGDRTPVTSSVYTPATLSPSSTPGVFTPNGFGESSDLPSASSPGYIRAGQSRASLPPQGMLSPSLSTMSFTSGHSPPKSAGGSHRSRHFLPSALSRKKSSGFASGDTHHNGLVGSAITGMRSLSMGIESWRKHSVSSSIGHGSTNPALGTEYDDLLRRDELERAAQSPEKGEGQYERNASLSTVDLPPPHSSRRQSEPHQHRHRASFGTSMSAFLADRHEAHSTMGGKNVKGLRLPLSDMHASSTAPKTNVTLAQPGEDSPAPTAETDSSAPLPGLLSPALISGSGRDSISSLPSPPVALAPPLSMGAAAKGTRRKPVPAAFATTLGPSAVPEATSIPLPRRVSAEVDEYGMLRQP